MLITGIPSIFGFSANRLLHTTVLTMINLSAIIHNWSRQIFKAVNMVFPRNEGALVLLLALIMKQHNCNESRKTYNRTLPPIDFSPASLCLNISPLKTKLLI